MAIIAFVVFYKEFFQYAEFIDPNSGRVSYTRRLFRDFYPRFHLYISENENVIEFDLHLDQKQARYPGTHAHNAEYDGPAVEKEMDRIRNQLRIAN